MKSVTHRFSGHVKLAYRAAIQGASRIASQAAILLIGALCLAAHSGAAEESLFDIANIDDRQTINSYILLSEVSDEQALLIEENPAEFIRNQLFPGAQLDAVTTHTEFDWQRNSSDSVLLDSPNGLQWFQFNLQNSSNVSKQVFLEFTDFDGVAWAIEDASGEYRLITPSYESYIGGRQVFDTEFIVPIEIAAGTSSQLVGFLYSISVPRVGSITAWNPESFRAQRTQQHFGDGAYYGFLLAIVIYNFALAIVMRQVAYFYAGFFQLCIGAIVFINTGYSLLFLIPNNVAYTVPIFALVTVFSSIAAGLFSISILKMEQYSRLLHNAWRTLVIFGFIQLPLVFVTTIPNDITPNSNRALLTLNALVFLFSQGLHIYTLVYFWNKASIAKFWFIAITIQVWMVMAWILTGANGVSFAEVFKTIVQIFTLINGAVLTWLINYTVREERRAREASQQEALANLQMANDIQRSKANFVSTAGHDLRQPLLAIRLHIEALKKSASTTTANVLSKVENNITEMSALLTSLMNLSKSMDYIDKDESEEFLLDEILHSLREEMEPFAGQKGLDLDIDNAPFLVHSNKVGLAQILRNLLGNSIKFTRTGKVSVKVEHIGETVSVSVLDTGPGIAEEELGKIFDEFYQVKSETQSKAGGMGLGLSIVRRLTESLDIPLNVESKVGRGTEFIIELKASKRAAIERSKVVDPSSLNGLCVAIVHSNETRSAELKQTLEKWGTMALAWPDLDLFQSYVSRHSWRPHLVILEYPPCDKVSKIEGLDEAKMKQTESALKRKYSWLRSLDVPTIALANNETINGESAIAVEVLFAPGSASSNLFRFSDPIRPGVLRSFIQRKVVKPAN